MDDPIFEFELDMTITGDGSSLWNGKASVGPWHVTRARLEGMISGDYPSGIWELLLHGDNIDWRCYTDHQIEKQVDAQLKAILSDKIGAPVECIVWSEQGMQPDDGWSFDVILK